MRKTTHVGSRTAAVIRSRQLKKNNIDKIPIWCHGSFLENIVFKNHVCKVGWQKNDTKYFKDKRSINFLSTVMFLGTSCSK